MEKTTSNNIQKNGFLRLPSVLDLIPISKSAWWQGVKTGRYPKPVKLSERVTVWRYTDIQKLIDGNMHDEMKGGI